MVQKTTPLKKDNLSWALILLVVGAILIYLQSLRFGFVLDDAKHILENSVVLKSNWWKESFTSALYPGDLYRPLTIFSYALEYKLLGDSPWHFHAINIALHFLNALLVFLFLKLLNLPKYAALASVLFLVLPANSETVSVVSSRSELLATFFALNGVISYLRNKNVVLVAILFFLAFLSKESSLIWVALIIAVSYQTKIWRTTAIFSCLLCAILFLLMRYMVLGEISPSNQDLFWVDNPLVQLPWYERVIHALALQATYLSKTILPLGFGVDYSYGAFDLQVTLETIVLVFLYAILLFSSLILFLQRKESYLAHGILFFSVSFLITANLLFPIGTIFAGRLVYLPSIGISLVLAVLLSKLKSKLIVFLITLPFLFVLNSDVQRFKSSEVLNNSEVRRNNHGVKTLVNHAYIKTQTREYSEALLSLLLAESITDKYADIYYYRAYLELQRGRPVLAREALERTLSLFPAHRRAIVLIGYVELALGNAKEAEKAFGYALSLEPLNPRALSGAILSKKMTTNKDYKSELETLYSYYPEIASSLLDEEKNSAH